MSERRLKGRYELLAVLGRGLATTTHLARDHETGARCVVKVLQLSARDALQAHELLTREARVLQRLEHPRIPRLVDFFTEDDGADTRVCLVQQHVEGRSLQDRVRGGGPLGEREAIALGTKLCQVLEYLHGFEPPILHRDLKPANVLLTPAERVYLVDFGAVRDHLPHAVLHPSGPTIVGTRGFMPIEQFEGHAVPGSDLYALGATLVFALSGKGPSELGKAGLRLAFEPHVAVSPGFARLLGRLLEPDWRERPLSAREVREELERLTHGTPRITKPWLVALAFATVAAAGVAVVIASRPRARQSRPEFAVAPPVAWDAAPSRSWWQGLFDSTSRVDAFGDPLPPHALRRLGTVRLRHGGPVRGVALTPDGASILSAGADGSVVVWSSQSGEERRRFELGEPAAALALSPDGSRVLVGAERFWTARLFALDGRPLARLFTAGLPNQPSVAVSQVAWSHDGALVATRTSSAVDVWAGRDGRHQRRLADCGAGRGLAFVGQGRTLLVACGDGSARLVDAATGAETRRLALPQHSRVPLVAAPDGRLVAQAVYNGIQLLDLSAPAAAKKLEDAELRSGEPSAFCFSPDGRLAAAGLANGRIVVWEVATLARRWVIEGPTGAVSALAVSRDARVLVAGGEDGSVRVFELDAGKERVTGTGHRSAVRGIDFLPGTGALLSAGADATLRRFERDGRETTLRSFDRPAEGVFVLPRARFAAVEEGRVHVYDAASGWEVSSHPLPLPGWRSPVLAVAPGRGLLAAGSASTVELVELGNGTRRTFAVPRREEPVAFSPDGSLLATLREGETPHAERPLVLRDAESGRELGLSPPLKGGAFHFRCRSSDGSYFGFNGYLTRLGGDPKARFEVIGWPGRPRQCAVSPDGRYVASAEDDDTITLRERVRAGAGRSELRALGELRGHRGPVTSLVFAPDSRTLVSGGADANILVWDVASIRQPAEARPRPAARAGPRLRLAFDDGIGGVGVAPVRVADASLLTLVPGRAGRALRPSIGLAFPETQGIVVGDEFTVMTAFRVEPAALDPGVHAVLSSELVTLDVRDGGKALLFFHFLQRGGHASVELTPWIGRVAVGRWYHVAASYRRSEAVSRVCVDGVCGPGPTGTYHSDRLGTLSLGRGTQVSGAVAIDELVVYDRALSDDQMAQAAGLARAVPLPSPTPHPTPTPLPRLPAEQEPLPREGLPEGRDVTHHVTVEEKDGFTVYRFGGPLARDQTLDLELGRGAVWLGTDLGLLRHDLRDGSFRLWDETSGLPGERLNEIAVVGNRVIVDSSKNTKPGYSVGTGVLKFEIETLAWTPMKDIGGVWDLKGDGSTLWLGSSRGAEMRDLETGALRRFTRAAGELVHDTVRAVRRHGDSVAFAAMGDYVKETKDFTGGGLTLWDRRADRFRSYTPREGLARGYSCDVYLDDDDVFVAHWDEERGLSRIDRRSGRVEVWPRSANGVELGGVVLAGDSRTLWIGQQGALVRLDRATRQATALHETDGLPGYIVSGIVIAEDAVWASVYAYGQDGVRSAGLVRFRR